MMSQSPHSLIHSFDGILDSLVEGEKYLQLPPKGPPKDFLSASNAELDALDQNAFGDDLSQDIFIDPHNKKTLPVEGFTKKAVHYPSSEDLDGLNVIGVTGDNKRIITTSFHLILARSAIVNFRYTKGFEKPYFYTRRRDASALMVVDNNIFEDDCGVHTYNDIVEELDAPLLDYLAYKNVNNKPFRFRYDHEKSKKAPSSQSLGLAVKFQHTLELASIDNTDFDQDGLTVCLKAGAMFSNSTSLKDIGNGLKQLLPWKERKRFFIAVSTGVMDSRVLITTLIEHSDLIEKYFPNQHITVGLIESFGTDSLLLKKILQPGDRTPFIEYIENTRKAAISSAELEGLKPITCYYHKRSKPYSFIRIEMPKFMWQNNQELAELAVSVAIWQYELGGSEPLVLKAAKEQCSLNHDQQVIEQQMKAAFEKKALDLIEF